jgi:hypothetical protein
VRDAVTDWRGSAGAAELLPVDSTLLARASELLNDSGDVRLDEATSEYVRASVAAARAWRLQRTMFGVLAMASLFALLLFLWWAFTGFLDRKTEAVLRADAQSLSERWAEGGLPALVLAIEDRLAGNIDDDAIYLLVDPTMRRVGGNLERWPAAVGTSGVWYELPVRRAGVDSQALVQRYDLPNGFHLLIGRDVQMRVEIRTLLIEALLWAVIGPACLVGVAAYVRKRLRRRALYPTRSRTRPHVLVGRSGNVTLPSQKRASSP